MSFLVSVNSVVDTINRLVFSRRIASHALERPHDGGLENGAL